MLKELQEMADAQYADFFDTVKDYIKEQNSVTREQIKTEEDFVKALGETMDEGFKDAVKDYMENTTPEQAEADGKFIEELCGMQSKSLLDSLREYMENRTPEEAREDEELMRKWENIGPTVDEYLEMVGFKEKKEGKDHE